MSEATPLRSPSPTNLNRTGEPRDAFAAAGRRRAVRFFVWGGLTILPALVHGHYANRWQHPPEVSQLAARLQQFPTMIGDWEMYQEGDPLSTSVQRELGLLGYLTRQYRHRDSGHVVSLLLLVGQPGPLIRHPPDVCYTSRANDPVGDPTTLLVEGEHNTPANRWRVLNYRRRNPLSSTFRVAYAHTTDGVWDTPAWPRLAYGSAPLLYKAQILYAPQTSALPDNVAEIIASFARAYCRAFRQHIVKQDPRDADRELW